MMNSRSATYVSTTPIEPVMATRPSLFKEHGREFFLMLIPIVVLWITVAVMVGLTMSQHGGVFVYALDDPYIHLAIAKNLALHGTWGIYPGQFASASSSLIWPPLLASIFLVTGPQVYAPLMLNIVFGTLLVGMIYWLLRTRGLPAWLSVATTTLTLFAMPMPTLILSGQEHILHTLVTLALLVAATTRIMEPDRRPSFWRPSTVALGALAVSTRYEGLFLVGIICLILMLRRRFGEAILLGMISILPVAIFGLISVHLGWHMLPNSVLLKGYRPSLTAPLDLLLNEVVRLSIFIVLAPGIVVLICACLLVFIKRTLRTTVSADLRLICGIFIGMTLMHLASADVGWLYRYEAYLVVVGLVIVALTYHQVWQQLPLRRRTMRLQLSMAVLVALLCFPFLVRGFRAAVGIVPAVNNIYEQQVQMARFVGAYYQDDSVALNDIGAVSYFTDANVVDLWGLANIDVANKRLVGHYDSQVLAESVTQNHAPIALVYDLWFTEIGGVPSNWIQVGRWKIDDQFVAGGDTVSIYATSPQEVAKLRTSLQQFSACLPKSVLQSGAYREASSAAPATCSVP